MKLIKAVVAVITTACNVVIKMLSAAERGANSLDNLAKIGELKSDNLYKLAADEDEAKFIKRKAKLDKVRMKAGLTASTIQSTQATKADKKAKEAQQVQAAQEQLDI